MNQITSSWLLGIGLVLAFDLGLSVLLPEGLQTRTVEARLHGQLSRPAPTIMVMGDSVAASGIDHAVLAGGLPPHLGTATVNNYALPGASPLYYETQLRRLLDDGKKPQVIILAPHPANLRLPRPDRFLGRFASTSEMWQFIRQYPNPTNLIHGLIARSSYSYRYRDEIRELFARGDAGFFRTLYLEATPQSDEVKAESAATLDHVDRPPAARRFGQIGAALQAPLVIDPTVEASLQRFYELALTNDIQIFWAQLPTSDSLAATPTYQNNQNILHAYLSTLETAKTLVVLGTSRTMPDYCFSDPWHFSSYGRKQYSRQLVADLAAALSSLPAVSSADGILPTMLRTRSQDITAKIEG